MAISTKLMPSSNNVAFTEAIGHVSDLESSVLGVQLAYITIATHIECTVFYFPRNYVTTFYL